MHEHKSRQKGFFQKIKQNHYLMAGICIMPIAILLAGNYFFDWKSNNLLLFVSLAACMAGHMLLMKNHQH